MSKQRVFIPPHIARLMSPADRKANGILTPEEEKQKQSLALEREIHRQFGGWLYRHRFEDYFKEWAVMGTLSWFATVLRRPHVPLSNFLIYPYENANHRNPQRIDY
jgi:hypothetical protein